MSWGFLAFSSVLRVAPPSEQAGKLEESAGQAAREHGCQHSTRSHHAGVSELAIMNTLSIEALATTDFVAAQAGGRR